MHNKSQSLSIWLKYLEKLPKKKIFDLLELKSLAKRLKLLNPKPFVFIVGGTNGKGTTCAMLEKLLLDSGYKVGLYTSPHIISYVERVKVNGCVIDEDKHVSSFKKIEFERGSTLLTYFEFITLSALILFKQYQLDAIILEVGLGGRLDATNIIDSDLSLITNIEIDHTLFLGKDRVSIAREKSGIFRKNIISVIGEVNIPDSMEHIAQEKKAILKKVNIDWSWFKNKNNWNFIHPRITLYNLPMTHIPLPNAAIALAALYYTNFKINENIIKNSIDKVKLSGRFQTIFNFPRVILDVAHNPDASLYLSKKIDEINIKGKIHAIVGILKDKDISGIIRPLENKIHFWYAALLDTNRTATLNQLRNNLPKNNTYFLNSIREAWETAYVAAEKQDIILIFGSFLTVAEFISIKNMKDKIKI